MIFFLRNRAEILIRDEFLVKIESLMLVLNI